MSPWVATTENEVGATWCSIVPSIRRMVEAWVRSPDHGLVHLTAQGLGERLG